MVNKKALTRIIAGFLLFAVAVPLSKRYELVGLALFLAAYLLVGLEVLLSSVRNILRGELFDENFLMSIATLGAFAIGEYPEGVAVMLFYQVGELFQSYAVDKSRRSIANLMDIRPDYANLRRGQELVTVDPDEVHIDDIIVIKPGEKIPLDSVVTEGSSMVDTSALTGESVPRSVNPGDSLISGCINLNGLITAQVTKEFGESTVSKILDLVENASSKKSQSENFITKFARYYTPAVVIVAVLLAALPPLVIPGAQFSDWLYRALTFLVISCPCALVISVPLSFFGGIGGASKMGILIKGSNYLELLSQTGTVVFDKTGTLTKGVFQVTKIAPQGFTEAELLELAAYAEEYSTHPISLSLKKAYRQPVDTARIAKVEEISGHGVSAVVDGKQVLAGNSKLMRKAQISFPETEAASGTVVHVAVDGSYAGYILISDELKPDAYQAISTLKSLGVNSVMLTGDSRKVALAVAGELGIDQVHAELLPGDKVDKLEGMMGHSGRKLAFVGDGINDAPVLARSDVGIAMGGLGSDAAIEAADIVIMTDEPSKIATAIKLSKRTLRIVKQNIIFALGVKALVLILGAAGMSTMWEAVFADVGVSVIAILNSMRALNTKNL